MIVPMVVLRIVLSALTARSEIAKADAGVAAATRTAIGVYGEQVERTRPALRRMARDEQLRLSVAAGETRAATHRLRERARAGMAVAEPSPQPR